MSKLSERMKSSSNARPINLERAIKVAKDLRDAKDRTSELEERLKVEKAEVTRLAEGVLVDVFDELGIDHVGVPSEGNHPAFDVTIRKFYEGGISAEWPEEKREAAFDLMERLGHGDLIKSIVTIEVPRGQVKLLDKVLLAARRIGLDARVRKGIHPSTFKAWLKEEVESGRKMPPLADIGAYVGRRGTIKERKE